MKPQLNLCTIIKKILKRPVYNHLSLSLYQNNLRDLNQSGFRVAPSTENALVAVIEKHSCRSAKLFSVLILKTLLSFLMSLGIQETAQVHFLPGGMFGSGDMEGI